MKKLVQFLGLFLMVSSIEICGYHLMGGEDPENNNPRNRHRNERTAKQDQYYKDLEQYHKDIKEPGKDASGELIVMENGQQPRPALPPLPPYPSSPFGYPIRDDLATENQFRDAYEAGQQRAIASIAYHRTMRSAPLDEQFKKMTYDAVVAGYQKSVVELAQIGFAKAWIGFWKTNADVRQEREEKKLNEQAKQLLKFKAGMAIIAAEEENIKFIETYQKNNPTEITPQQLRLAQERKNRLQELVKRHAQEFDAYQKSYRESLQAKKAAAPAA